MRRLAPEPGTSWEQTETCEESRCTGERRGALEARFSLYSGMESSMDHHHSTITMISSVRRRRVHDPAVFDALSLRDGSGPNSFEV
jgi:hypothetical protein